MRIVAPPGQEALARGLASACCAVLVEAALHAPLAQAAARLAAG